MAREQTRGSATPIVELARRQHGVVSLDQLRASGISWEQLRTRERMGWLRRIHRGVYLVAAAPLTQRARWRAATLACGDRAVLSHQDAAALWKIAPIRQADHEPVHVTIEGQNRRRHPGIIDHRSRAFPPDEIGSRDGIPVTSPPRTILDLAGLGVPGRSLERAADEAERLRLCGADELVETLRRHPRRAGARSLGFLLSRHEIGSTLTRSELEERFLRLCRRSALPHPLVNVEVIGLTVDFLWPPNLVVEVDGAESHATRRAFQDDRDRDSLLVAHGYRVLRFTWWDVARRPRVVVNRVARSLSGETIRSVTNPDRENRALGHLARDRPDK